MKKLVTLMFVLWAVPVWADCTGSGLSWSCASGSTAAQVNTAITNATSGATITLASGAYTWTEHVVNNGKYIKLVGAGSGGYVGRSTTSVDVGTGSKTFTVTIRPGFTLVNGETITARQNDRLGVNYLTGTVTSYSGGSLVLNVTSTGGSGTCNSWVFERPSLTTITNSAVSSTGEGMISFTESTSGSIEFSGIRFAQGSGTWGGHITVTGVTGGKPVLVHDNWFSMDGDPNIGPIYHGVHLDANRGVIYLNSFNGRLCSNDLAGCVAGIGAAVVMKNIGLWSSWSTASTMGTADTDGQHNFYVEDNYLVALWQAGIGPDSAARMVARNNVFIDSNLGWHGSDSEHPGSRHWEIYDNEFVQTNANGRSYNLNQWVQSRGGTGVITGNTIPNIYSGDYGDRGEINFYVYIVETNYGGYYGCWGAGIPGVQYPAPRQNGLGYVTGTAGNTPDGMYFGDSEPIYVWANTGTYVAATNSVGNGCGADADSVYDYVVSGRDYFWNAGAKPGWSRYTYPHPLRSGIVSPPSAPTNVRIR